MGLLLYLIANILFTFLTIINLIVVLWKNTRKRNFFRVIDGYLYEGAKDIDCFANHNYRTLWNTVLIKKKGYQFGNQAETISSALGKNQRDGTLTWLGKQLVSILNLLDKDHCIKSINDFSDSK